MTRLPHEEMRTLGAHQFRLSRRARPSALSGVANAYSLEHLGNGGQTHEWLGSFAEPDHAWAMALLHAQAYDISGYCDGAILVRIARNGGKIHQARLGVSTTTCGLELPGLALKYRVPGDGRDAGQITCDCCVPRGIPMRWRSPHPNRQVALRGAGDPESNLPA